MIYVCGNCGREVEVDKQGVYPGTSEPALIIEPCVCLRDEKVSFIEEELRTVTAQIIGKLGDLRRSL